MKKFILNLGVISFLVLAARHSRNKQHDYSFIKRETIDEDIRITEQDIIDVLDGLQDREETLFQFGCKCFERGYSELY